MKNVNEDLCTHIIFADIRWNQIRIGQYLKNTKNPDITVRELSKYYLKCEREELEIRYKYLHSKELQKCIRKVRK